jgi:hypothetical protein
MARLERRGQQIHAATPSSRMGNSTRGEQARYRRTDHGNGNGGQGKMSDVQRAKLIDLYQELHGGERNDAVKALDKLFLDQFKHGGKDATYEDATKLTAQLLAEQTETKTKSKK